jgi:pimeloyl-ACP methyl ester carboxylesterase
MSASSAPLPTPEGPGSVSGAPNLPAGFTDTFTSRYIDAGGLRQHAVVGGEGPPLLLVHGWPQTWYAWRLVMPGLARDFQVVVPDQRGCGLSDKPADGYDTGTLAGDLVALMEALGHQRFTMAGHDTGMWIGYALAADHPGRVDRLAVAETPLPGVSPSPPLFANAHLNDAPTSSSLPDGKRSTSAGSSPPRPPGNCPTTRSGTTSMPSPPAPKPCTPASRSTVHSTPPSRKTSSASNGGWPCPSWPSAARTAWVNRSRTR